MPEDKNLVLRNEDVRTIVVEIPEGHQHLRTTITLENGTSLTFQEATIANLVRAYITVKTHPKKERIVLVGQRLLSRKEGYAEWQLLERDDLTHPGDSRNQKSLDA